MGHEVTVQGPVTIQASLSCARSILRACLIRDGKTLEWTDIDQQQARIELVDPEPEPGYHWYVVTVEMESAYEDTALAHASPYFVTVT